MLFALNTLSFTRLTPTNHKSELTADITEMAKSFTQFAIAKQVKFEIWSKMKTLKFLIQIELEIQTLF